MIFRFLRNRSEAENIHFYDPLLNMRYFSWLTVRIVTNTWVVVHVVGTATLLLADIQWAFWLGVLNFLYLLDRLLHYARPQEYLPEYGGEHGNIARYFTPRARRAVISAHSRSSILGGGFFLNLARILSETKPVVEMLARLDVDHKEFGSKIDAYVNKETASYRNEERLLGEVEYLTLVAFGNRRRGQRSIDYADLFAALGGVKNEQAVSLFGVFEINGVSLERVAFFGRQKAVIGYINNLLGLTTRKIYKLYEDVPTETVSADEAVIILFNHVLELEKTYRVFVLYSAIETAIGISARYFNALPVFQSAEKLLHTASLYVSRRGDYIVRDNDVLSAGDSSAGTAY